MNREIEIDFCAADGTESLRDYQKEAVQATIENWVATPEINSVVSLPTGSGKTHVIAALAALTFHRKIASLNDLLTNGRVLIASHVKELLEQSYARLASAIGAENVGLFSAGLGREDARSAIVVGGIQSIWNKTDRLGAFDLVMIDECHLVSDDDASRYQKLARDLRAVNPKVHFVGFTATPFRMKTGLICKKDSLFNKIVYEKNVAELIDEGYLSNLHCRVVKGEIETKGLHKRAGEFVESEVDALVNAEGMVEAACQEIVEKARLYERRKVLIFASNVKHARRIKEHIERFANEECGLVLGETPSNERDEILTRFRSPSSDPRALNFVTNVGVLTTGFDNPTIDEVAIIRPTASPGLYYQMAGRGLRVFPGKEYCLLLDFGQNIKRHGPIDDLEIKTRKRRRTPKLKSCPKCGLIVTAATRKCPWCGRDFPILPSQTKLTGVSSDLEPISRVVLSYLTEEGIDVMRDVASDAYYDYENGLTNDKSEEDGRRFFLDLARSNLEHNDVDEDKFRASDLPERLIDAEEYKKNWSKKSLGDVHRSYLDEFDEALYEARVYKLLLIAFKKILAQEAGETSLKELKKQRYFKGMIDKCLKYKIAILETMGKRVAECCELIDALDELHVAYPDEYKTPLETLSSDVPNAINPFAPPVTSAVDIRNLADEAWLATYNPEFVPGLYSWFLTKVYCRVLLGDDQRSLCFLELFEYYWLDDVYYGMEEEGVRSEIHKWIKSIVRSSARGERSFLKRYRIEADFLKLTSYSIEERLSALNKLEESLQKLSQTRFENVAEERRICRTLLAEEESLVALSNSRANYRNYREILENPGSTSQVRRFVDGVKKELEEELAARPNDASSPK